MGTAKVNEQGLCLDTENTTARTKTSKIEVKKNVHFQNGEEHKEDNNQQKPTD